MTGLLEGQGVLITGGTGTFARAFIPHCLREGAHRIVAFARHEVEMAYLEAKFGSGDHDQMRYFIGDVCDYQRLKMAMRDIDVVIHAAAMKRIEQCERDPLACKAVNIDGSENVVLASLDMNIKRCLLLSTDKAEAPVNLYGASKMAAERFFLASNNMSGGRCVFAAVRYGNIWASRGSVIHHWRAAMAAGEPIKVTDPEATRFFVRVKEAVRLVQVALEQMNNGPVKGVIVGFPYPPAYRLGDLANAFGHDWTTTHLPPHEKKHEALNCEVHSDNVRRMTMAELRDEIAKLETTA